MCNAVFFGLCKVQENWHRAKEDNFRVQESRPKENFREEDPLVCQKEDGFEIAPPVSSRSRQPGKLAPHEARIRCVG